jgi:hypothetical protein
MSEFLNPLLPQFESTSAIPVLITSLLAVLGAGGDFGDAHFLKLQQQSLASVHHLSIISRMCIDRANVLRFAGQTRRFVKEYAESYDRLAAEVSAAEAMDMSLSLQNDTKIISDSDDHFQLKIDIPGEQSMDDFAMIQSGLRLQRRTRTTPSQTIRMNRVPDFLGSLMGQTSSGGQMPQLTGSFRSKSSKSPVVISPCSVEDEMRELCGMFGKKGVPDEGNRKKMLRVFRAWRREKTPGVNPAHLVPFNMACTELEHILEDKVLIPKRVRDVKMLLRRARSHIDLL